MTQFRRLLTAVALAWLTSPALAATPAPSNEARSGNFVLLELFTDDDARFLKEWQQPTPPNLTTTHHVVRNQPVILMVIVGGCAANARDQCDVIGDITITDPNGKPYGEHKAVDIFRQPGRNGVLMLSPTSIGLRVEDGEALGRYKIAVTATDRVTGKSLGVFDYVDVTEAPTPAR